MIVRIRTMCSINEGSYYYSESIIMRDLSFKMLAAEFLQGNCVFYQTGPYIRSVTQLILCNLPRPALLHNLIANFFHQLLLSEVAPLP